jgi:hypothetical protein
VERRQPRRAIVVGQRDPVAHFLDVGGRMEIIAVEELPAKAVAQQMTHGGLAGGRDPHQQEQH